jgi:serine protease
MKKTRITLAIASAMAVSVAGMAGASATELRAEAPRGQAEGPSAGEGGYRFIVKYRDGSAEARDTRFVDAGLASAVQRAGLDAARGSGKAAAARTPVVAKHLRRTAVPGWNVVTTSRALDAQEAQGFLRELAADANIERAEIDPLFQRLQTTSPAMVPNDPNYAQYQWNFRNAVGGVRAEEAWDLANGEGVVVAILDTGIVQNHVDLGANVVPGYDMISDSRISRRATNDRVAGGWDLGDWIEQNYCVQLGAPPHPAETSSWHGSHVAGTVAQETNNGVGLAGLAHGAKVQPIRVLGSCGGFGSDISDGMIWAAGGNVAGLPANATPAEVLNMSLGSRSPAACPAIYQDAINQVNGLGAIVVVAAGNSNGNAGSYTMSSCNNVISVGATGITGAKASYSNYGPRVDLSAPGGGGAVDGNPNGYIWQVTNGGTQGPVAGNWILRGFTGTSMSSPHVAAVAAMVQSALVEAGRDPLSWDEMRDLLTETARPFPVSIPASTPMGAGILDARAALEKALEEPCDPAVEECGPTATPIVNKVPVNGLSGNAGSEALFALEVPAGVSGPLSITTSGGSGNVTLLVSRGTEPNLGAAEYTSARPGNNEAVRVANPQAGTYYIKLVGAAAFGNVRLLASHN